LEKKRRKIGRQRTLDVPIRKIGRQRSTDVLIRNKDRQIENSIRSDIKTKVLNIITQTALPYPSKVSVLLETL
jgi:hypothetical protein